ncbi:MAG: metallophosphoesterase [Actinobacteria bacterium]|nr:metallophosphoesterase [Actinomycetota bacterium]
MPSELSIFYAADLHGADRCFGKWLNAGPFYGADVVVIGGDLTGKVLLPLYPAAGGRLGATWHGRELTLERGPELDGFAARARAEGAYPYETTPEEMAEIQASAPREREVFARLKVAALEEWLARAEAKLAGAGVRALVMIGNDDPPQVDEVLSSSSVLEDVQGRAVELADGIWIASRGESTPTPWHTPREIPDDELGRRVEEVVAQVPEDAVAIWNLHMPPFDTGIDRAPRLDDRLRVQYDGSSQPIMDPVGSRSVRRLIEERQPTLALHGHIHEGRGRYVLGKTVGFNPGSVYSEGTLLGVLVRVSSNRGVRSYTFTSG